MATGHLLDKTRFSTLSTAERIELYRAAGNVRGCAACRYAQPDAHPPCSQKMPAANWGGPCDFFEREAGAD